MVFIYVWCVMTCDVLRCLWFFFSCPIRTKHNPGCGISDDFKLFRKKHHVAKCSVGWSIIMMQSKVLNSSAAWQHAYIIPHTFVISALYPAFNNQVHQGWIKTDTVSDSFWREESLLEFCEIVCCSIRLYFACITISSMYGWPNSVNSNKTQFIVCIFVSGSRCGVSTWVWCEGWICSPTSGLMLISVLFLP